MWKVIGTWKIYIRYYLSHKATCLVLMGLAILSFSTPVFAMTPTRLLQQAYQAEETGVAHYARISIWVTPLKTETVFDEIWRDTAGNWRLERRSDSWDNGLIAVSDEYKLTITVPYMPYALQVPANTNVFAGTARSLITPALFCEHAAADFTVQGEDTVLGRSAIVLVWKTKECEIRRWIDKLTLLPLREERVDITKRPVLVSVRQELPVGKTPTYIDNLNMENISPAQWQYQAIVTWLEAKMNCQLPLVSILPDWLQVEWVDLRLEAKEQVAVLLINTDKHLASIWLSAASGTRPVSRPLLAQGRTVITRRVGNVDITIVAATERQASHILKNMIVISSAVANNK